MRKPMPTIREQERELQERLRREKIPHRKIKLHMLVLLKSGKASDRQTVAEQLAVHRNTVGRWLFQYEEGGIKALLEIRTPRRRRGQRTLPPEVVQALRQRLQDPAGFGSYGELQNWLRQIHGQEVKYKTLYRIVRYELKANPKRRRIANE
ncbi:MAG: helix-turn-helix domain-containing protein [Acidobacteria bacterium]|nr:helix-turn-helix domain-containing protein [Acidobacteriota bacterium]